MRETELPFGGEDSTQPLIRHSQDNLSGSSAEVMASQLRERIIRGVLAPGAPLRETKLSSSMGVSRRTVREGLLLLARQGLVDHTRNRGAFVRRLDERDVADLYRIRRTLETQGARAAVFASDRARHHLRETFGAFQESVLTGISHLIVRSDLAFHRAVIGLIESPRIDDFYSHISPEMELAISVIRGAEDEHDTPADKVIAEHARIHDSLQARDTHEAQVAILEHIDANERYLINTMTRLPEGHP